MLRSPAVLVVLSGVTAALHIGKVPPAIPLLREAFGFSLTEAGFLLSIIQLAGMLVGVLAGMMAQSIGLRRCMLAGLSVLGAASAMAGLARDVSDLLWLRGLEGVGFLMVVLPAPALIRRLVLPDALAIQLGMWGGYMPMGTAISLLVSTSAMAIMGWQGWWLLLAGMTALMALCGYLFIPADKPPVVSSLYPSGQAMLSRMFGRLSETLSSPGPWVVSLIFAFYSSQWLAVIGFLPSIYEQAGVTGSIGSTLTALVAIVNMVGSIAAGRLLFRGVSSKKLLQTGFLCMAIGSFLAFSVVSKTQPLLAYFSLLLFSAVGGMIPSVLFSLAVRLAPSDESVPATVGWMQQCSSMGQFLGPPFLALGVELSGSWDFAWAFTAAASFAGVFLARKAYELSQK